MRALLVALLFVVVAAMAMSPASAATEPASAPLRGEVASGLAGFAVPGRPVPVRVTLTADELVSGVVQARLGDGPAELVDIEIAGGATEVHWMLLDAPLSLPGEVTGSAQVRGRTIALAAAPIQSRPDTQLVGTLDGLGGAGIDGAETVVGGQELQLVPLEPALLDLGPDALAALDSIAVTPDGLASLSDEHRRAILGWLTLGGTLYVDGEPGLVPGWPEELQPTVPVVHTGAATVVTTGGALAAGRWGEVISPAASRSVGDDGLAGQVLPSGDGGQELFGADLGRDLPSLASLLGMLGVYTVLVGPIAYLVFRRRVMARWLVIPALALAATGVLVVSNDGNDAEAAATVVDVIETGPGAAMATTRLLMASETADRPITAPVGWTARTNDQAGAMGQFQGGFNGGGGFNGASGPGFGSDVTQQRRPSGVEITVPVEAGGVGMLDAQGPVAFDGALEVTASADRDGRVTGVVRNATRVVLEEVAVVFGNTTGTSVGILEPGASAEFELTAVTDFRFPSDPFGEVWAGRGGFGDPMGVPTTMVRPDGVNGVIAIGPGEDCVPGMACQSGLSSCIGPGCTGPVARPGSLAAAFRDRGINAYARGLVTAVGWTQELPPVVDLGRGVQVSDSRTAIVGRAVVAAAGDRLVDAASIRRQVSFSGGMGGAIDIVTTFDLPVDVGGRAVDEGRLRLEVPSTYDRIEVLTTGGPRLVLDRPAGLGVEPVIGPAGRVEVELPEGSIVRGQVVLQLVTKAVPPSGGRDIVLYEVGP